MLRINGIVRLANTVRSRLSGPINAVDLAALRGHVERNLAGVARALADHGTTEASLPTPSRRAMAFLRSVDWTRAPLAEQTAGQARVSRKFGWRGLTRHFEIILHNLWAAASEPAVDEAHGVILRLSRHLESGIQRHGEENLELSDGTAGIRGWLAFFANREDLIRYVSALQRARQTLSATLERHWPRCRQTICFRPMDAIYQIKATSQTCPLSLPTPMITFSGDDFAWLAGLIGRRDSAVRQEVVKAMERSDYQAVRRELDRLGGLRSHLGGVHHSLETVFARVNERFFRGLMPRPRLVWSAVITARKFGHYDIVQDTLLISATVDRADVPEFVIDFLMYHELLHKEMGVDRSGGRAYAHTPEFRAAERRFPQYQEAEAFLLGLAKRQ
ncbi:MAG: hypothetical protein ACHRHE_08715 [Tepidisphaerales bacterium]